MRAYLNLRYTIHSRVEAFVAGLNACGFALGNRLDADLFCTWNRVGDADKIAKEFEAQGKPVIVAENAAWGNEFLGGKWHTLALGRHNTAGCFPVGGPERWDSLGVKLAPWREEGETVILGQRGIGAYGMPKDWPSTVKHLGRYRPHPGRETGISLEHDLRNCGKVITWGSGAAVKALMWGIKVESHMPSWVAEQDNTDEGRLNMFRRLAWCTFDLSEISTGEPFRMILSYHRYMKQLKVCPFCGEVPEHIHVYAGEEIIRCVMDTCPVQPIVGGDTEMEAATSWNNRILVAD